jgi:precorrin isomerase
MVKIFVDAAMVMAGLRRRDQKNLFAGSVHVANCINAVRATMLTNIFADKAAFIVK